MVRKDVKDSGVAQRQERNAEKRKKIKGREVEIAILKPERRE